MKTRALPGGCFLVGYDYGMGGIYQMVRARSSAEIESRFPEVVVFAEYPSWVLASDRREFEGEVLDIDAPGIEDSLFFRAVLADRNGGSRI